MEKLKHDQLRRILEIRTRRETTPLPQQTTSREEPDTFGFYAFLAGIVSTFFTFFMYMSAWILIKMADPAKGPNGMAVWVSTPINLVVIFTVFFLLVFIPISINKLRHDSRRRSE
jgi:hypothetical protein